MTDNNLTSSTSGQEELEKPIPPAVHSNNGHGHGHGHGHSHVQQSHQLIDKLAAETKPLALPLPLPLPLPGVSTDSSVSSSSKNCGTLEVGLKVEGSCTKNDSEIDLGQSGNRSENIATATTVTNNGNGVTNNSGQNRSSISSTIAASTTSPSSSSGEVIRKIELEILPSIGEGFQLQQVNYNESVVNLKKIIINKLKLQNREQITLLYREKVLLMGLITDYGICHGSRITLLPSIETGLLTQRPEQSVLEALEGLNETQINDFLSGKSPLNLTMRLGEHVMLIQLQLSKGQALAAAAAAAASHRQSQHSVSTATSSSSGKSIPISSSSFPSTSSFSNKSDDSNTSSSPTLAEASRNLTKTLKRISSKVNKVTTNGTTMSSHSSKHHRSSPSTSSSSRARESKGDDEEIINLKHHGKGVYSGTFSGTLNPALQDSLGKPRKHVSTIVHILNDLLGTIDLRSGEHSIGEVGLKSATIGTSNSLKRKKTSSGRRTSNGSSGSTNGQLLTDALASECTDSEESHDSVLTKPAVALKLQKMSKDGDDDNSKNPPVVVISKDEENRLLRLKIEKLKENLLARKLKRNS